MPIRTRTQSTSGYYHVTQRGNAQGLIFEHDNDRRQFLRILKRYKVELGYRVIAWCLMDNHFHLILDVMDDDLSSVMQHIECAYIHYFNTSRGRTGHVFQGPYHSVPIESEGQLLATVDYVHRNPEKAGICEAGEYRWSSLQEYQGLHYVVDTEPVLDLVGNVDALLSYEGDPRDVAHTIRVKHGMSDDEVLGLMRRFYGNEFVLTLRSGNQEERDDAIRRLRSHNVPARQIARLASISRRQLERIR